MRRGQVYLEEGVVLSNKAKICDETFTQDKEQSGALYFAKVEPLFVLFVVTQSAMVKTLVIYSIDDHFSFRQSLPFLRPNNLAY